MNFKIELPLEAVNTILASLAKQPYEAVAPVIDTIQKQCEPQMIAAQTEQVTDEPDQDVEVAE